MRNVCQTHICAKGIRALTCASFCLYFSFHSHYSSLFVYLSFSNKYIFNRWLNCEFISHTQTRTKETISNSFRTNTHTPWLNFLKAALICGKMHWVWNLSQNSRFSFSLSIGQLDFITILHCCTLHMYTLKV